MPDYHIPIQYNQKGWQGIYFGGLVVFTSAAKYCDIS